MQTQSNSKYIIGLIGVVVIVAIVVGMRSGDESSELKTNKNISTVTENELESMEEKTDSDGVSEVSDGVVVNEMSAGKYLSYDAGAIASSEAENIVLLFTAPWCPSCNALDANISKNLTNIPANTEIYKVDFDTQTELKKKYGVTMQHTMVTIDKDGNMIKKWSGGTTLNHLLSNLI